MFFLNSPGIQSNRDPWVYNYSRGKLLSHIQETIEFYNNLVENQDLLKRVPSNLPRDEKKIKWTPSLIAEYERGNAATFEPEATKTVLYRPFTKQFLYFGDKLIHRPGKSKKYFPTAKYDNLLICLSGIGDTKDFSVVMSDRDCDVQLQSNGQCFPLYYYDRDLAENATLFDTAGERQFVRRDGVSDFIAKRAKEQYGVEVKKEDIFYYVYGFLHSPEYREKFANDLKKMLPRIPLVDEMADFVAFAKAGRKLADLHLNYEKVPPHPDVVVEGDEHGIFTVTKMKFLAKDRKDTILYNNRITVSNIPTKAYEYVINGKSAIEWIMERYVDKTDPASGIRNNANNWADEVGNERYILDLLLSIVNVSVQTVDIVAGLPKVQFD